MADRGDLSPLPEDHRRGLIVLTGISFLSLISTSCLWTFITVKLLAFRIRSFRRGRERRKRRKSGDDQDRLRAQRALPDLSMGLDLESFYGGGPPDISVLEELSKKRDEQAAKEAEQERQRQLEDQGPTMAEKMTARANPFPILVYNLLFADMMEAMAYGLSIDWIVQDGISAPSPTCWAQGWLGSTSNLATSLFLSATSINTFLTIVLGYKMPRWGLYCLIGGLWTFVFLVNATGVLLAEHGTMRNAAGESYFMRANVWVSLIKSRLVSLQNLMLICLVLDLGRVHRLEVVVSLLLGYCLRSAHCVPVRYDLLGPLCS